MILRGLIPQCTLWVGWGITEESKQKCEAKSRGIEIIESKNQVGKEETRVQLKLFEACFMPVLIFGREA